MKKGPMFMECVEDIHCAKTSITCSLDRGAALRFMKQDGPMDSALAKRFEDMASHCETLFPVYAAWRTFALKHPQEPDQAMALEGTDLLLPGRNIARNLDGATHAVLIACTLGMDHEKEAARLNAKNALDALLFDACTSSLVDSGADAVQSQIEASLHNVGYETVRHRYSPGYGDLPLDIQPAFLATIDAEKNLGLYVIDQNFLVPAKSITAILGIRPRSS